MLNKLISALTPKMFENIDIDSILDKRDSSPFDTNWVREFEEIEKLKAKVQISDNTEIRKLVFMKCYEMGAKELAEYISDDFGLIFDSIELQYKSEFIDKLCDDYLNYRMPQ